jgi:hypothetical protein
VKSQVVSILGVEVFLVYLTLIITCRFHTSSNDVKRWCREWETTNFERVSDGLSAADCMPSSGLNEWNARPKTVILVVVRMMSLTKKKLETVWMEAVVVQFKISHLYLHRKTEEKHENSQWGQAESWPRFEPGTSRMQLTLFLRNLISKHSFKTESSIILLPKNFLVNCLEFLNYLQVTIFKIHRDGALNLDFDTKRYSPCPGYCLVNPEMSAGDILQQIRISNKE